jgi:hypothetical protein
MSEIGNLFEQAQLAEAAYANFVDNAGRLLTNRTLIENALKTGGSSFSPAQATAFVDKWDVIDHIPDTKAGFSATIFQQNQRGQSHLTF